MSTIYEYRFGGLIEVIKWQYLATDIKSSSILSHFSKMIYIFCRAAPHFSRIVHGICCCCVRYDVYKSIWL